MTNQEIIFVVVDPNDTTHVAFDRALRTAPLRAVPPRLHILVTTDRECVDTGAGNERLYRNPSWFDETIRAPLAECGLDYEIEVSWCQEWQQSILFAAERIGASEIFIPMRNKPYGMRLNFSESKWELLKTAKCPVALIRPDTTPERKTILAAVNFQTTDPQQKILNSKILQRGNWLAKGYNADFHLVNGYMDSMRYPDRGKLVNESGLASEKIHVLQGYTDKVVAEVANKIKADVVILGTLGQNGKASNRRGNTAERVISAINCDAVIINA